MDWILVNEEIPNSFSDNVLVTILDESGDSAYSYVDVGWCLNDGDNSWIVDDELRKDVVAWMPFPKAYQKKEKGDEKMTWDEFNNIPLQEYTGQLLTNIECPKCKRKIYFDETIILTSYPAKYSYWCACGWTGFSPIKWDSNQDKHTTACKAE